jgi:hypothetical protein
VNKISLDPPPFIPLPDLIGEGEKVEGN